MLRFLCAISSRLFGEKFSHSSSSALLWFLPRYLLASRRREFFIAHSSLCRFIILMMLLLTAVVVKLLLLLMILLGIGAILMFNHFYGRRKEGEKVGRYLECLDKFHDNGTENILNKEAYLFLSLFSLNKKTGNFPIFLQFPVKLNHTSLLFFVRFATPWSSTNDSLIHSLPRISTFIFIYHTTTSLQIYENFRLFPQQPPTAFSFTWTSSTFSCCCRAFSRRKKRKTFFSSFSYFPRIFLGSVLFTQ